MVAGGVVVVVYFVEGRGVVFAVESRICSFVGGELRWMCVLWCGVWCWVEERGGGGR